MSIAARARSMTTHEVLNLYTVSSKEEQKELSEELYKRLLYLAEHPGRSPNSYHHIYN